MSSTEKQAETNGLVTAADMAACPVCGSAITVDHVTRIRAGLAAKALRPTDLARRLNVSTQTVYQFLARRRPGTRWMPAIAEYLGTAVEYLTIGAPPFPAWSPECRAALHAPACSPVSLDAEATLQPVSGQA